MATHEIPILGAFTAPDSTGKCFFQPAEVAMTLSNLDLGTMLVCTMNGNEAGNLGVYGKFNIPQNYAGTPKIIIRGALEEAANTIAFGITFTPGVDDNESMDQAYDTADTNSNATWTGYAVDDIYELAITLTPAAAFAAGDEVFYYFYRDGANDSQTGDFHLTGLFFQYSDT